MAEHGTIAHTAAPEHHAEPTAFGLDAPAWIALAMVAVFAILLWKRVPAIIGAALDSKIAGIRAQLDEAAQLRAEAEALKAEYEAKSAQADAEAATMIERARRAGRGGARAHDRAPPHRGAGHRRSGRGRRRRSGRAPRAHGRGQDRRRGT